MSDKPAKKSPKGGVPSRSDTDIRQFCVDDSLQLNVFQRAKRKFLSGDSNSSELETLKVEIIEMIKEMLSTQNGI